MARRRQYHPARLILLACLAGIHVQADDTELLLAQGPVSGIGAITHGQVAGYGDPQESRGYSKALIG